MKAALAAALALALGACATPGPTAAPPTYTDLSQAFVDFYDRTEGLDDAARVAAFRREVAPLYPGFYSTRGRRTEEQQDQLILANIERFAEIRDKYAAVQRAASSIPAIVGTARVASERGGEPAAAPAKTSRASAVARMHGAATRRARRLSG